MAVTVPGTSAGSPVTVTTGTDDVLNLASQIGALLSTIQGAGNLSVLSDGSQGPIPGPLGGGTNELLLTAAAVSGVLVGPAGNYNVVVASGSDTLIGFNQTIIGGDGNDSITALGTSTVAVGNGANTITAANNYVISTGNGNNQIIATGTGTIATGTGDDTVTVFYSGANTVEASGSSLVWSGAGNLDFVGGAGTSTIVGHDGGSQVITAGAGGVNLITFSNDTATVFGGAGVANIGGGSGSDVTFNSSLAGAVFNAGAGNETLSASGTASDTFYAGSGDTSMTGGQGTNTYAFFAGHTGGADVITDFNSSTQLLLVGYTSVSEADTAAGIKLTLSDNTTITLSNVHEFSEVAAYTKVI